jgi:hypothetical protein
LIAFLLLMAVPVLLLLLIWWNFRPSLRRRALMSLVCALGTPVMLAGGHGFGVVPPWALLVVMTQGPFQFNIAELFFGWTSVAFAIAFALGSLIASAKRRWQSQNGDQDE